MPYHLLNYDGEVRQCDHLLLPRLHKALPRTLFHFGGIVRSRTPQFAHRLGHNNYKIKRKGQGGISGFISIGTAGSDDS